MQLYLDYLRDYLMAVHECHSAVDRQCLHKMTSHSHSPGVVSPLITEILLTINSSTVDNRENCGPKLSAIIAAMDVHIACNYCGINS